MITFRISTIALSLFQPFQLLFKKVFIFNGVTVSRDKTPKVVKQTAAHASVKYCHKYAALDPFGHIMFFKKVDDGGGDTV